MLRVGLHVAVGLQQGIDGTSQRCGGAYILGHAAHIKGPGPGFQAGKDIDKAGSDSGNADGQSGAETHGSPSGPAKGAIRRENGIVVAVGPADQRLLIVDPYIQTIIFVRGKCADIGKDPVAEGGVPG